MLYKKNGKKIYQKREGENIDISNRSKNRNKSSKFQELKDKTLAKVKTSSKSQLLPNKTT